MSIGVFDDSSLFAKVLSNTLTPDQSPKYEALRLIERAAALAVIEIGSLPPLNH